MNRQDNLFENQEPKTRNQEPVECLGKTFDSDEARREHFLGLLREGLEELHAKLGGVSFTTVEDAVERMESVEKWPMGDDARLRELAERMRHADSSKDLLQRWKDEVGFPHGEIEGILNLSDPPYYTACPNPFIADFIKHYGKPYDPKALYNKKPFSADITEGRHTWLYKAHTYHTKVPPKALKRFIEHYTDPGDIVLDGFAGSGMTGVAGLMTDATRCTLICDLSPAASFIAATYLASLNPDAFWQEAQRIADLLDNELGWMYRPEDGSASPPICNYYVWSDVFLCDSCGSEIVFWDAAFDAKRKKFLDVFKCPSCGAENSKTSAERAQETLFDPILRKPWTRYKQVPVVAAVSRGGRRADKRKVNETDLELLTKVRNSNPPTGAHRLAVKMLFRDGQWGDQWKNCLHLRPVTHVHQLFAERQVHYIGRFFELLDVHRPEHRALLFTGTSVLQKTSRLMVYNADGIGRVQKGTLYISSVWQEMRFSHMLRIAAADMIRATKEGMWTTLPSKRGRDGTFNAVWTGSSTRLPIADDSVDYVFVDPPFGSNIPYSEVNFLWETLFGVFTNVVPDAVESPIQHKALPDYQRLMEQCFSEFRRVLKPGRWITIEFHNSKNSVWNSIQEALTRSGFVVADVRILDKKQKSFKQATTAGAVKQDLIITAYKPNGGLEERFRLTAGTEEGVWDFVRTHLAQLPVAVVRTEGRGLRTESDHSALSTQSSALDIVAERQKYLLFDRMVAFHVQRGVTVPLSAAEFYAGLAQRFPERDGMYFLPEQVAEYDKKRMKVKEVLQLQLFVTDEASAIQWLKQQLTRKPQTFQELHPQFLKEIGGWQKHEKPLELSELLEQNFLRYDGKGEVPSQIHSYLSSNFKELRNLPKDDERLRAKAKDRWYVPDPNKAGDLEKLRERALLREFEEYRESKQKRLKVFRLEAVRAGFKKAWQEREYATIIAVARKIPENVLQEDPKLLMWYDQALTRMGEE